MTMCCRVGNLLPKVCWRCGKFLREIDELGKKGCTDADLCICM